MQTDSSRGPADAGTIWIEDETLRSGFTQLPNSLLVRKDVPAGAKIVYQGLLSFAWQADSCFPGQTALAERVGLSPRSVFTHLKQLQQVGLLTVERRGQGMTNLYTLKRFDPILNRNSCETGIANLASLDSQGLRGTYTQSKKKQRKGYIPRIAARKARDDRGPVGWTATSGDLDPDLPRPKKMPPPDRGIPLT